MVAKNCTKDRALKARVCKKQDTDSARHCNEDRGGCGPHSGSKEPVLALGAKTGSQSAKVSDVADVTAHAEEPPQAFNETKVV